MEITDNTGVHPAPTSLFRLAMGPDTGFLWPRALPKPQTGYPAPKLPGLVVDGLYTCLVPGSTLWTLDQPGSPGAHLILLAVKWSLKIAGALSEYTAGFRLRLSPLLWVAWP